MAFIGTLCYILNKNKILLKKATRGISKNKWNGSGGKIEGNETPEKNIIRETFEETGLTIKNLLYHGQMNFFLNGKNELSFAVHLFSTKNFTGNVKSTEEGEVKWFDIDNIPFDDMWADDRYWMPLMLRGKKFDADFYFDNNNAKIIKHEFRMK